MIAEETPPWQQHVHTTALSEFVVYSISERDKKVGLVPWATATGSDVLLSKDILERTMLLWKYVAYLETTVGTYPHVLQPGPLLVSSMTLPPLHQKGPIGMGRTLFPSMARISLSAMNRTNRMYGKTAPLSFLPMKRWRKTT